MDILNAYLSLLKKPELLTTALEFQHAIKDNAAACSLLLWRLENLETDLVLVKEGVREEKKKNRRLNHYIDDIELYAIKGTIMEIRLL